MDVNAYLARIGETRLQAPDFTFLSRLVERHFYTVPFENLDIHLGRPIRLDPDAIYHKIVHRRRGGFCYELNSAFGSLLHSLGFNVSYISGRVRTSSGGFGPEYDHMALLVGLEEEYLVDVGFGDSCRLPLPLSGERKKDISGWYRIKPRSKQPGVFALEKKNGRRWSPEYLFTTRPRKLEDFACMCEIQQTSPTSVFRQHLICTIATPGGRITVSDNHFTITERGEKQKIPIQSANDRELIIRRWMGIDSRSQSLYSPVFPGS
ncbi:arylamine N-acetyltransferase family protein [Salinithrix halophila]|uniref:Arylamine N-acetyltransferase n=1 Tax=Salinithrix halophila TaxID=1485204 RepID=A0ABV8JG54_9BACL